MGHFSFGLLTLCTKIASGFPIAKLEGYGLEKKSQLKKYGNHTEFLREPYGTFPASFLSIYLCFFSPYICMVFIHYKAYGITKKSYITKSNTSNTHMPFEHIFSLLNIQSIKAKIIRAHARLPVFLCLVHKFSKAVR